MRSNNKFQNRKLWQKINDYSKKKGILQWKNVWIQKSTQIISWKLYKYNRDFYSSQTLEENVLEENSWLDDRPLNEIMKIIENNTHLI